MNEQSQDLLAAFENPEMAPEMPAQEVPVENAAPIYQAAPVAPAPVAPAVAPAPQPMVDPSVVMPAEFQNAPEPTPVAPTPAVEPVAPTPVAPAPVAPVAETPVAPVQETEVPVEDNQNVMPNVSEEPAVAVNQEIKVEEVKEDTPSVKKNLVFIAIICVIIAAFIIFLPKIMGLLNGGSF